MTDRDKKLNDLAKFLHRMQMHLKASTIQFLPYSDIGNPVNGLRVVIDGKGIFGIGRYENNRPVSPLLKGMDLEDALIRTEKEDL